MQRCRRAGLNSLASPVYSFPGSLLQDELVQRHNRDRPPQPRVLTLMLVGYAAPRVSRCTRQILFLNQCVAALPRDSVSQHPGKVRTHET
jgi:hypothetical protein